MCISGHIWAVGPGTFGRLVIGAGRKACVLLSCSYIIAAATIHDVVAKTVIQAIVLERFRNRTSASRAVHVVTGLQASDSQEEMLDVLIEFHLVQ